MRVLFLCPNLNTGGAERHWSILLPGLRSRGLSVGLATLDGRGPFFSDLEQAGIPAVSFADRGRRGTAVALRSLRTTNADVIVTRATSADGLAMLATLGRPAKWIVNWHRPAGVPLAPRRVLMLRSILSLADAVLGVSEAQIPELLGYGVRRDTIRVIPNGTDFPDMTDRRGEKRQELGLAEGEVAVLFAGRLEPQKRPDIFIEALALAQREHPQLAGLIAGAGPLEADLRRQAQEAAVNVRFLGRRDDMPEIVAAADVLALSSDQEALPYVVLEAMAVGRPVVATRTGSLPEVVTPAVGVITALGDVPEFAAALAKLAADGALRSALGAAGRDRQRRLYSADAMCDAYADAILRVFSGAS